MLGDNMIPPAIQAIFLKEGIPLSSFTTIPNDHDVESIMTGRIDALFGYVINEPYQLEMRGLDTHVFQPHEYGIDFYGDMLEKHIYATINNQDFKSALKKYF